MLGVGIVGLSATGGWASRAHVPALAAVDGVASVDPVRDVSIAPPEADVQ